MKKCFVFFAAAMLVAGMAFAYQTFTFHCDGFGNMVKASPPIYTGGITGPDCAPGTWTMTVPDAGWPGIGNSAARWAHIWSNYYALHYDDFFCIWTGTFDAELDIVHTGVGTMNGVCDITFQILDGDCDQIMDPEECSDGLSGAVIIIHEGTGAYAELCGNGSYSGFYTRLCSLPASDPSFMLDEVHFDMELLLDECGMGTDLSTWGAVKALFR